MSSTMNSTRSTHRSVQSVLAALLVGAFTSGMAAEQEIKSSLSGSQLASAPSPAQVETATLATETNQDPKGLDPVTIGPLVITPSKTVVRLEPILGRGDLDFCFMPVVRFKVRNTSAGDVRVVLFSSSIAAIDEIGISLYTNRTDRIEGKGLNLLNLEQSQWGNAYAKNKSSYITLGSKQVIEVQLLPAEHYRVCRPDKDGSFRKSYKPKTMTFSATINVVDAQENETVRSFSFSEAPLQVLQ